MPRVICAGHVNWDVTLHVDRLPEPDGEAVIESQTGDGGGSAANVACGLAGLEVPVALLGSVGEDDHGESARAELLDAGVDCGTLQTVPGGETAVKYLVVAADGGVFVLGRDGANEAFTAGHLPEPTLASADHLHLTSQRPDTAARLAVRAAEAGVTVSFDPGRRLGDRDFSGALSRADLVFLNDREAATALGDALDPADRTLVLKHGPRGAEVRTEAATHTHPGFAVETVDTTGAGDAFATGFIAARLRGDGFDGALAVANACGALAAGTRGSRTALDWKRVRDVLSH
ncbi:carbohydrate kinase family protein [Halegenticoccus tardaugens]|uniref:carbohydrate kinase family protein n=1 Tax=Halegenticoccus tardaugens TaxID=2071624 RepID=UPI00100BF89C|nr:PfkB family carbohydrate kinase [Halegenticoccus tardaugens]